MAVEDVTTKCCTKCGKMKRMTEFAMRKDRTNSIRSICKKCANELSKQWRLNNPDKQRDLFKKWSDKNKEKRRIYLSEWKKRRRSNVCSIRKKKVRNATDIARESCRGRRNPEKNREMVAKWRINNPEKVRIKNQNYRARLRGASGVLSKDLAPKLYSLQRGRCACCGVKLGNKFHRDHIMPLALGGLNVDLNIQLLCQPCNSKKHAKHPVDFMKENGFLL